MTDLKQFGFKRIKKYFKERQLQVFIQRKQNEFAIKAKCLVKLDQILSSALKRNKKEIINEIITVYMQKTLKEQENRRNSL